MTSWFRRLYDRCFSSYTSYEVELLGKLEAMVVRCKRAEFKVKLLEKELGVMSNDVVEGVVSGGRQSARGLLDDLIVDSRNKVQGFRVIKDKLDWEGLSEDEEWALWYLLKELDLR